jgi:transposase-like protein
MDIHENARTTRHGRMLIIERLRAGWSVASIADTLGVTAKTVRKWRDRFAAEGTAGLASGLSPAPPLLRGRPATPRE